MDPLGHLPLDKPSMAVHAMNRCATVSPQSPGSPVVGGGLAGAEDNVERVDWEEMRSLGCDWALAAPLACSRPRCERLLGAVLIAGKSTASSFPGSEFGQIGPSINPEWLKEWSCELAQGIAHASVSVMESSLDMLRLLYPPKVVEALVYNAIAPGGHPEEAEHLAELLDFSAATQDAHDDVNADVSNTAAAAVAALSASPAEFSLSAPTTTESSKTGQDVSENATLASTETEELSSPGKSTVAKTLGARNLPFVYHNYPATAVSAAGAAPGQSRNFSPVHHSPFAALSATTTSFSQNQAPPPPGRTTSAGGEKGAPSSSSGTTSEPVSTERTSTERTSTDSFEERGEAFGRRPTSRRLSSPSHMAAAVLRQASLQSRQSLLNSNEDLSSMSPANSEVEGYEDLLTEDAAVRAMRRPSNQIDRAHSYGSMESGATSDGSGSDSKNDSDGGNQEGNQNHRSTAPLSGAPPASSQAAGGLVPGQGEQQGHQTGGPSFSGEEATEGDNSPRVGVVFPAPYATNTLHNNINQELGARSGDDGGGTGVDHYNNGGTTTVLHPHRTFHEHQAAYSQNQQNQQHPHHQQQQQQQQQQMHPRALSTISEGGRSSQYETMTSRSLSSQLNSFSTQSSPGLSLSSTPASSLHWDQEWDLAFADARVEKKFTKHAISKLVAAEAAIGVTALVLAATFFAIYPRFSLNQLFNLDSGGLFPLLLIFTLPLVVSLGAREAWTQHRMLILPGLRLLSALISAAWLVSLGLASIQAVPLGVLSLTNPMRLRFHIPLQLFCMWASVGPSIAAFVIAFLIPTAAIYIGEQRLRRRFLLDSLAAATAAAAAASANAGTGAGATSPRPAAAAGVSSK